MAASISPLPEDVAAQIKSSSTIVSLNDVLEGLICNSLDAEATKIEIRVNYQLGSCVVRDNGSGIPPQDLGEHGNFGRQYCTSRSGSSLQVHGRNGSFIALLASLALIKVTSKHRDHDSENSVICHRGKIRARSSPGSEQIISEFIDHGTLVVVRDLFGDLPVRLKQRTLMAKASNAFTKSWLELENHIVAFLLSWPSPVKVVITDSHSGKSRYLGQKPLSRQLFGDFDQRNHRIYLLQSLVPHAKQDIKSSLQEWQTVSASSDFARLDAIISLAPAPTKNLQSISIGVRPVFADPGFNILYECVNGAFIDSDFGIEDDLHEPSSFSSRIKERDRLASYLRMKPQRKKGVNRWPAFHIQIEILGPPSDSKALTSHSDAFAADYDLQRLSSMIQTMLATFLEEHGFNPRSKQPRTPKVSTAPEAQNSKIAIARLDSESPTVDDSQKNLRRTRLRNEPDASLMNFQSWSRIKSGNLQFFGDVFALSACRLSQSVSRQEDQNVAQTSTHCLDRHGNEEKAEQNVGSSSSSRDLVDRSQMIATSREDFVEWTDTATNRAYKIDCRTGQALPDDTLTSRDLSDLTPAKHAHQVWKACLSARSIKPRVDKPDETSMTWAKDLASEWVNPIFEVAEVSLSKTSNEVFHLGCGSKPLQCLEGFQTTSNSWSVGSDKQIAKEHLKSAEVIAQVDNKFILCKMPSREPPPVSSSLFILIDQHAADERCRVEELLKGLVSSSEIKFLQTDETITVVCHIETHFFERSISFDIATDEAKLFSSYAQHFATWGILYTLNSSPLIGAGSTSLLSVRSVPPSIAERCRTEPKMLIDLLRTELWIAHEKLRSRFTPQNPSGKDDASNWIQKLASCPQGAIMFNDVLTTAECRELVARLSHCSFPFVCAHGRPSMVPIVSLGSGSTMTGTDHLETLPSPGEQQASRKMWRTYAQNSQK